MNESDLLSLRDRSEHGSDIVEGIYDFSLLWPLTTTYKGHMRTQ